MLSRRHFAWCVLAVSLLALPALTARSGSFDDARRVLGEPPPGGSTWILVETPRRPSRVAGASGIQLHTSGQRDVTADLNPTTGAAGVIRDPHTCKCTHYHGRLFGQGDPDANGCGWGCVVPFETAPRSVAHLSTARMHELRASGALTRGDLAAAPGHLAAAVDALDDVSVSLGEEQQARKLTAKVARKARKLVRRARAHDLRASREASEGDRRGAARALRQAENRKRALLRLLVGRYRLAPRD